MGKFCFFISFENRDPPLGFENSQIEIGKFFGFFPVPPIWEFAKISILTPPLNQS